MVIVCFDGLTCRRIVAKALFNTLLELTDKTVQVSVNCVLSISKAILTFGNMSGKRKHKPTMKHLLLQTTQTVLSPFYFVRSMSDSHEFWCFWLIHQWVKNVHKTDQVAVTQHGCKPWIYAGLWVHEMESYVNKLGTGTDCCIKLISEVQLSSITLYLCENHKSGHEKASLSILTLCTPWWC